MVKTEIDFHLDVGIPATMRNTRLSQAFSLWITIFLLLIPQGFCENIIGGRDVPPHSRPYMVLLQTKTDRCAGALIDKDWVLTAAHCNLNKNTQIILGAHSITKEEDTKQIRSLKKQINYPCYDSETFEHDLKLSQLNESATINKNVDILKLPNFPAKGNDMKPNSKCKVAGWGKVGNNAPSDTLKEVIVTIIDRKICNDQKHYNYNPMIGPNMICAGNRKLRRDTCEGDSGSPLICNDQLRGITSFGRPGKCGDLHSPGVYTLLAKKHINWIKMQIRQAV